MGEGPRERERVEHHPLPPGSGLLRPRFLSEALGDPGSTHSEADGFPLGWVLWRCISSGRKSPEGVHLEPEIPTDGSGPFLAMTQLLTQPPPPTACALQREAERASGPLPRALPAVPLTQTCPGLPLCLRPQVGDSGLCQPSIPVLCNSVPCGSPGLACMGASMTPLSPTACPLAWGCTGRRGEPGTFLVFFFASELPSGQGLLPTLGLRVVPAPQRAGHRGPQHFSLFCHPSRSSQCQPSASCPGLDLHVGTAQRFLSKTGKEGAALPSALGQGRVF